MAMPGRHASIPNSGNQFWQGHTAIGREPVVKIKKPSGIVRFSADFAKTFGVRSTCREWSELGSRDIGGKTRRMRVRARTALGSELLELGLLLANVRSWALGSPNDERLAFDRFRPLVLECGRVAIAELSEGELSLRRIGLLVFLLQPGEQPRCADARSLVRSERQIPLPPLWNRA
jgi:hypothetical protein